jgi:5-bromo-4-chloroindolyl phosphate hydrolysis protein
LTKTIDVPYVFQNIRQFNENQRCWSKALKNIRNINGFCQKLSKPKGKSTFLVQNLEKHKEHQHGWSKTLKKPKENQHFWSKTLKHIRKINICDQKHWKT